MKRGHNFPGLWINFEAGEGAGKGKQVELLYSYLKDMGFLVAKGREPGSTAAGEQFRIILQNPDMPELHPKTELLTYIAAGIELFNKEIKPVLQKGGIFITDRWRFSTQAYQGHGLGLDLELIKMLTNFSCDGNYPDLNILIDIEPERGLSKISGNEFGSHKMDKLEARGIDFHKKIYDGYKKIAEENAENFFVVPYLENQIETMHQKIKEKVEELIKKHDIKNI